MPVEPKRVYRFAAFLLDIEERLLLRNREAVPLPAKSFDTLALLVKNSGHLVTKETLMAEVWRDSVVEENTVNRSISVLRKTLGDASYIETVPKHGYRFVTDVFEVGATDNSLIIERQTTAEILIEDEISEAELAPAPAQPVASAPLTRSPGRLRRYLPALLAAIVAITGIVALALTLRPGDSAPNPPIKSIAVLPFQTINSDLENAHQGMALADNLITRLSRIKELRVRPTSAVMAVAAQDGDSRQAGRELQVDAVLEGTIYRAANRVRVTARLLSSSDLSPIWAGQFETPVQDELRLQDEIALQLVEALAVTLSGTEMSALTRRHTENSDAYQLYLKGRYLWNKRDHAGLVEAERLFRNAIAKDPTFALAYVGLADKWVFGNDPGDAYSLVSKALELDPDLAEAYATRGFFYTFHAWNWPAAEADFKRSIELTPGYATAHQWYATLLMIQGRLEEAKAELRRALEINPVSYNLLTDLAEAHYYAREYDQAEAYCRNALTIYPEYEFAHGRLQAIYLQTGKYEKAIQEYFLDPRLTPYKLAYQKDGSRGFWQVQIAEQLRNKTRNANWYLGVARAYLESGELGKAIDYLEMAHNQKAFLMPFINVDPAYDRLRATPRFQAILQQMKLR